MKYLLDTNTCIRYINGTSQSVFERLNAQGEGEISIILMQATILTTAFRSFTYDFS